MLAYFLALAVGLGSFSIYMAAFFFPEVHRKSDFAWSGVGFFYALVLWACAGRITGALLLGQMAGVALLGWLAWETLSLRRQVTPIAQQTPIPASVNLKGVAGGSFPSFFGKKPDTAPKKPKFVRSNKPKSEVTTAPVPTTSEVKVEEQPTTPPVAELISESSIDPTPESAIAPELPVSDSIAPPPQPIPVWSIETAVAQTPPAPAGSAPSNETPLPLEVSEIAAAPTVEPAEAQPKAKQEPEADDFEQMWRASAKESQSAAGSAAPTANSKANSTPTTVTKKSGGFGSLFGNLKNSLGGMLGRSSGKSKPPASPQTPTPATVSESIEPASPPPTSATPAPDIDQILESELAEAAVEAAETSTTAVEESPGVPFPPDVETMAELMATETASSPKIEETSIEPSETEVRTSSETLEKPPVPDEVAELTESVDAEAKSPIPPLEMTVVEVVLATPAENEGASDSGSSPKLEVEAISVEVISIKSTDEEPSQAAEKPELIRPNPPAPDAVESAKPSAESKSENISSEQPPTV
jgi:Ycf66 protein N-terminus